MNFDQIFISYRDQTVSFKMFGYIFCNLIFIQIFISSVNQKLRIITVCKLILFYVYTVYISYLFVPPYSKFKNSIAYFYLLSNEIFLTIFRLISCIPFFPASTFGIRKGLPENWRTYTWMIYFVAELRQCSNLTNKFVRLTGVRLEWITFVANLRQCTISRT